MCLMHVGCAFMCDSYHVACAFICVIHMHHIRHASHMHHTYIRHASHTFWVLHRVISHMYKRSHDTWERIMGTVTHEWAVSRAKTQKHILSTTQGHMTHERESWGRSHLSMGLFFIWMGRYIWICRFTCVMALHGFTSHMWIYHTHLYAWHSSWFVHMCDVTLLPSVGITWLRITHMCEFIMFGIQRFVFACFSHSYVRRDTCLTYGYVMPHVWMGHVTLLKRN